jgi:hypothetical protein
MLLVSWAEAVASASCDLACMVGNVRDDISFVAAPLQGTVMIVLEG